MIFYALITVTLVLASIALFLWNLRRVTRAIFSVIAFNTAGSNPMARLVPNVAFLALFLLLINATWF